MAYAYEARKKAVIVAPEGEPIYSEKATEVYIEDESCGEFVVVEQSADDYGKVGFDVEEWELIKSVIDEMIKECRK